MQQSWDFRIKVVGTHSRLSGHRPPVFQGREGGGLARLVEPEEMFMGERERLGRMTVWRKVFRMK